MKDQDIHIPFNDGQVPVTNGPASSVNMGAVSSGMDELNRREAEKLGILDHPYYAKYGTEYLSVCQNYGKDFADWYFQAREILKGTQWESQMASLDDVKYSPNIWQQMGESVNDFSGRQAFMNTNAMNVKEQINSLLEAKRQYEQNLPSAQAARMGDAGINTSLPGNSDAISPGGSEVSPDQTPNGVPGGNESGTTFKEAVGAGLNVISSIASITEVLRSGISVAQAVEDYKHTKTENRVSEIKEITGAVPGLSNFLANLAPSVDWTDPATGQLIKAGTPLQASQKDAYINSLGLRPSSAKLLKGMLGMVQYDKNGNPTTGYKAAQTKLEAGILDDASKIVEIKSSPGFHEHLPTWVKRYSELTTELKTQQLQLTLRAENELAKYSIATKNEKTGTVSADSQMALDTFNKDYYNKLDPEVASGAQNEEYYARKREAIKRGYEADVQASVLGFYARCIREVNDSSMPQELKDDLLMGYYAQYNEYMSGILRLREEELAKGRGVITSKDWLDFGAKIGGDIIGLLPSFGKISKAIEQLVGKRKGKGSD